MSQQGKIFIVDGPDYTGKTELSQYLAMRMDAVYFHYPAGKHPFTNGLYSLIKKYPDISIEAKDVAMVSMVIENNYRVNELKKQGKRVIMDRSVLSTYVYQNFDPLLFKKFNDLFKIPEVDYDFCVVLTANKEELMRRKKSREDSDILDDYFMDNIDTILKRYETLTPDFFPESMIIDTTSWNKKDVNSYVSYILYTML